MKRCIIIRHDTQKEASAGHHHRLPYEAAANALMNAKGYAEYVIRNGYHFTDTLAETVSGKMRNADGTPHTWTASEVRAVMSTLPAHHNVTWGDMTYLANMAYADFYPKVLPTENACIQYAKAVANDVDGYDGMPFCRWTADAIGRGDSVEWCEM